MSERNFIFSLISSLALYKSLKSLQIFKISFLFLFFLLSRDHDSQNLVSHVNKIPRLIQNRYMYLELDELFVTWPWRAEIGVRNPSLYSITLFNKHCCWQSVVNLNTTRRLQNFNLNNQIQSSSKVSQVFYFWYNLSFAVPKFAAVPV